MLQNLDLNYCATIVQVSNLQKLENLDNLLGFPIFNYQALVSKDTKEGDIGVLFVAGSQLSGDFVHKNNLYRKSEFNADVSQTGYIEEKRRVKALKLRGNYSTALFMPLSSLDYLGYDFKVGDTFTHVNGHEVCKKYLIIEQKKSTPGEKKQRKVKKTTVEPKLFPEHIDTSHYARNKHLFQYDEVVIVTSKLHGTSARFCHQKVRKLSLLEKLNNRIFFKNQRINNFKYDLLTKIDNFTRRFYPAKYSWQTIAGSRTVIKDNYAQSGYYTHDVWNDNLLKIQHLIPKNWVIYGEIVGWAGQKPIQKNYTYSIPQEDNQFFVYRIAIINDDGIQVDLSWDAIVDFCVKTGMKAVPELWRGYHKDFEVDKFMDKRYSDMGYDSPELDPGFNDEGVIVRKEGMMPLLLKAKCQSFLAHEEKLLDKGEVDIETQESTNEVL